MPTRLPDFIGLGTQKGGTTSLHQWLNSHPNVYMPECKEVHYFDLNHKKPKSWYSEYFNRAKKTQQCGEITPFYLFHPEVAERMHQTIPRARLIILLRDPAERSISQIRHSIKRGFEPLSPEMAIEEEERRLSTNNVFHLQKHSYISRSTYMNQIDKYEALYSKEQILVMKSEKLFENPQEAWELILNFLKLPPTPMTLRLPKANTGRGETVQITDDLREKIRSKLKETAIEVKEKYNFGWEWAER